MNSATQYQVQVISALTGMFIRNVRQEESAAFDAKQEHPLFRAGQLAFSRNIRISDHETLAPWNGPGIQNGT